MADVYSLLFDGTGPPHFLQLRSTVVHKQHIVNDCPLITYNGGLSVDDIAVNLLGTQCI